MILPAGAGWAKSAQDFARAGAKRPLPARNPAITPLGGFRTMGRILSSCEATLTIVMAEYIANSFIFLHGIEVKLATLTQYSVVLCMKN